MIAWLKGDPVSKHTDSHSQHDVIVISFARFGYCQIHIYTVGNQKKKEVNSIEIDKVEKFVTWFTRWKKSETS